MPRLGIPALLVLAIYFNGACRSTPPAPSGKVPPTTPKSKSPVKFYGSSGDPETSTEILTSTVVPKPSQTIATGTPEDRQILINPTLHHQTMDGIGANSYTYPVANDLEYRWNRVNFAFSEVKLAYIRFAPWFPWWEPINDNPDANAPNWQAFQSQLTIAEDHNVPFTRFVQRYGSKLTPGIFNLPEWMTRGAPRRLPEDMRPELAESIATYLIYLRKQGVKIEVAEVANEPDLDMVVGYQKPEALHAALKQTIKTFKNMGVTQKFHAPNVGSPGPTVAWAKPLLEDPEIKPHLQAISYHTWWSKDPKEYQAIAELSQAHDIPVWATEVGYCPLRDGCFGNKKYLRPETWDTAFDYALSYYRAIAWSRASRVYHWALMGFDAAVGPMGQRHPSYFVLKHFANYIPPRSVYIESISANAQVKSLAFQRLDGRISLILLNESKEAQKAFFGSSDARALKIDYGVSSQPGNFEQKLKRPEPGQLELPAQSITSLILTVSSAAEAEKSQIRSLK